MLVEHAVIVKFKYGLDNLDPLYDLEDRLLQAIEAAAAGEYDGNEVAADLTDGTLYMYGPDADALYAAVLPHLSAATFMKGAVCTRRYGSAGDAGAKEVRTTI